MYHIIIPPPPQCYGRTMSIMYCTESQFPLLTTVLWTIPTTQLHYNSPPPPPLPPHPPTPHSAIDYTYQVQRMPYVDYSSKQMDPLLTKQEILEQGGVTKAQWRLQRKRFSVRVEFEQAGSLGTWGFFSCSFFPSPFLFSPSPFFSPPFFLSSFLSSFFFLHAHSTSSIFKRFF